MQEGEVTDVKVFLGSVSTVELLRFRLAIVIILTLKLYYDHFFYIPRGSSLYDSALQNSANSIFLKCCKEWSWLELFRKLHCERTVGLIKDENKYVTLLTYNIRNVAQEFAALRKSVSKNVNEQMIQNELSCILELLFRCM